MRYIIFRVQNIQKHMRAQFVDVGIKVNEQCQLFITGLIPSGSDQICQRNIIHIKLNANP